MLASVSHKFVFFHFPKTGGSSITYALAPFLKHNPKVPVEWHTPPDPSVGFMGWQPNHHLDLIQHSPMKECYYPDDYFTASFVRNPYDIVVSAWHNKEQSFEQFVMEEVATRKNVISRHGCQLDYLSDEDGNLLVDWIGRYEHFERDWEKFCYLAKVGSLPLKKLNSSWKQPYKEYYNERTYLTVTNIYKKDLDYFGYTLDK